MLNRRGSILVTAYVVLFVLLILGGAFLSRTVSDKKLFDIVRERTEAFYLAEAAVDTALVGLKNSYSTYTGTSAPVSLGRGEFEATVETLSSTRKKITAYGYVPSKAQKRAQRRIEAVTKKQTPPNFYDYAIYSAGNITLNGNSYQINGDVIYATTLNDDDHISGTSTQDLSISPLAQFDFAVLRAVAISQGNYYDAARLEDVQQKNDSFPSGFYNDPPTNTIPNVVYCEGDMVLNGNIGTIGGFFLVVGNVLTDPTDSGDSTINGNGTVDGCIYALGNFRVNGGGGNLNVNGGVWAGEEARLNGNATVTYNQGFMDAVEAYVNGLGAGSVVQLLSWRELE